MRVDWLNEVENKFGHPAIVLWRAIELKHIEEVLNKYPLNEPILDLGCAEGKIAGLLFKGKKLIGLDNSWEFLSQNKENETYRALVLTDACNMPFKDGFFSSVFSNCVIEHIPDVNKVLSEISRVLKPNGLFFFTVPSHKFADYLFFSIIFEKLGLRFLSHWYKNKRNALLKHFHCYDKETWNNILLSKGFKVLNSRYYMGENSAFVWDFLAFIFLLGKKIKINLDNNSFLLKAARLAYASDITMGKSGAGLLIICSKRGH